MSKKQPPKLAKRFFQWYCNPQLEEQILGDLEEQFEEDLKDYGYKKARRRFWWSVIRFFRKDIIKPANGGKLNYYSMIKNDFKAAFRVIKKDRFYSTINILGLTSGFVIALLILIYVRYEQSYEDYNPNAEKIVRITMDYLDGETIIDQDCDTYHALGPMIKEEFPEVTDFARAFGLDGTEVEVQNQWYRERNVYAADPSFLSMFGYSLIEGDEKTALQNANEVVLTESTAKKYFGKTDVVGEQINLFSSSIKVVGVVNDPPPNTHLKFSLLLSYVSMKKQLDKRKDAWGSNDTFTYLELESPDKFGAFQSNLSTLSDRLQREDLLPDERVIGQKIKDIHLYSHKSFEAEQNGNAKLVFFLLGVALLIIIIALLNYINLSTAKAMDRAKEAGIRKVVGSSTGQLRVRFFIESVLLNLMAGCFAILVIWLAFDSYKNMSGLPENLEILNDPAAWLMLGTLIFVSIILSGIFPAFILGSLKPITVLKGKFSHSKSGTWMRKALVITQFAIAIFLLIQTFTASEQLQYMIQKDLGINPNKVIVMNAPTEVKSNDEYGVLKNAIEQRTSFMKVGLSSTVPGLPTTFMGSTTNIQLDEETRDLKNNFYIYLVDTSFMSTLDMEVIAGSGFEEKSNFKYPFIVNEEALRIWGISKPEDVIHKKATFWGREQTLTGVVKDFHQLGAKEDILPMIFINWAESPDYISVRLANGNVLDQVAELEEIYTDHFPNSPFESFFLDQNFDAQYRADRQFQQVFTILSGFAILITCLGLFGLASFTVAKRTKEIGIRKVLGASVSQIVGLLSKDFIALVGVSTIIAIPITWLLVQNWLSQYSFRIEVSFWIFLLPIILVLSIAFVTVFSKAFQAASINPAESLMDE